MKKGADGGERMSNDDGMDRAVRKAYVLLPEIEERRSTLRHIKLALPIVILVLVFGGLYTLYSTAHTNIYDKKDELMKEFQQRASSILPKIERQARETAERVLPKLEKELSAAQAKAARKLPEALIRQSKELQAKLERNMEAQLNDALTDVKNRQAAALRKQLGMHLDCKPEETRDLCNQKDATFKAILDGMTDAYSEWAIEEVETTFTSHLIALEDIRKTMNGFITAENPNVGDGAPAVLATGAAPSDMLMMFLELVADSFGNADPLFRGPGVKETDAKSTKKNTVKREERR